MCGVTKGGLSLEGVDMSKETVIQGIVTIGGAPASVGYVRLLDSSGEFTAEVPTSATGGFRFFAAPGTWTVRAMTRGGNADRAVVAGLGQVAELEISIV